MLTFFKFKSMLTMPTVYCTFIERPVYKSIEVIYSA